MSEDFGSINVIAVFGLGLATGLLVPLLAGRRGRQVLLEASGPSRRYSILAVGAVALVAAATLIAGHRDAPELVASGPVPARHHMVLPERSLQDAVAVSARLLGRGSSAVPVATTPRRGEVAALLAQAEEHRRKREFKQACEVYAVVVERGGMTADAWADYADAQAGVSGSLSGASGRAIDAALALDPNHPKALWLEASLAHEEARYGDALRTWQALLAVVQPGSSDARIVTANIAEATRLASN